MLVVTTACSGDNEPLVSGPIVTFSTQPAPGSSATTVAPTDAVPATSDSSVATAPPTATADTPPAPTAPLGDPPVDLTAVGDFSDPVDLAWRAGDPTMFVVGQEGVVVPVRDGQAGEPVLDISDLTERRGERGLLGLTFAADGATAYINHTDNGGETIIASYAVDADGVFDPASRTEMLKIDQPYGNHNGGNVTIGPDGMLYIGMGDGGSGGDPERRALNRPACSARSCASIPRRPPTRRTRCPTTIPSSASMAHCLRSGRSVCATRGG